MDEQALAGRCGRVPKGRGDGLWAIPQQLRNEMKLPVLIPLASIYARALALWQDHYV